MLRGFAFCFSKLCQLPEKVAEFEMELDRVEGWLGGAEQLIERAHKPIEPGADKIRVSCYVMMVIT